MEATGFVRGCPDIEHTLTDIYIFIIETPLHPLPITPSFLYSISTIHAPTVKSRQSGLNCIQRRKTKTYKNQVERRASSLCVGLPLSVLLLNERTLAFSLHLPLLHEEVVLNPEGESVHHHRDYYDNNNELQDGVVLDPAHDEEGELLEGVLEPVLEAEEHSLSNTDHRHPDQELDQPGLIVNPKCLWEYWYLSMDWVAGSFTGAGWSAWG